MAEVEKKDSTPTDSVADVRKSGEEKTPSSIEIQALPPPAEQAAPTIEFPEGGFWAWASLAGAFLVQYATFGYANAFGVYQDWYVRVYLTKYSPSEIGWIGGTQLFLIISFGIVAGALFDKGHFYKLMITSIILHAVSLFTLSATHENSFYQVFLSHGVAFGLSGGIIYVPSIAIATHYFQKKRALAMSIPAIGAALGSILHPIMLNKLFNGSVGFRNGVRISAAMNTFLMIIAAFLMKPRLPPRATKKYPIGQWFKEPEYFLSIIAAICAFLGLFYPVFYLQLTAIKAGVDHTLAFYSLSILNAGSLFGRLAGGLLAQKFGVMNTQCFFTVATGGTAYAMMAVDDTPSTILFGLFYGFFSGGAITLNPPFVAALAKDVGEIGLRFAIVLTFGGILTLFATPIAGAIVGDNENFKGAVIFAGTTLLVGSIFYVIPRTIKSRKLGTQWL